MKIVVMGSGGVGGYFGARLAAAGNDVTFVARGAHLEAMRKGGLRLDSQLGSLHLNPVKVVSDAREIAGADAVLFAVKMRDTESAAESLRALTAGGATVFTFQNGVESGARIGRILGPGKMVEGAARIATHIAEPGVLKQIGDFAERRAAGQPAPELYEAVGLRADGSTFDVEVRVTPLDFDGRPGSQAILRDITGRKRMEAGLKESEERYRLLFERNLAEALAVIQFHGQQHIAQDRHQVVGLGRGALAAQE